MKNDNNANPAQPPAKPMRKPRASTIYKKAARVIRMAAALVGGINGCDEAQAQLKDLEEFILQKLHEMKEAARTAKKAAEIEAPEA